MSRIQHYSETVALLLMTAIGQMAFAAFATDYDWVNFVLGVWLTVWLWAIIIYRSWKTLP